MSKRKWLPQVMDRCKKFEKILQLKIHNGAKNTFNIEMIKTFYFIAILFY